MYNLTKVSSATSFFDFASFVHDVFPAFFVLMMVAIWVVILVIGAYCGFPQAGLIASFVCAILCIPLVMAGLVSLYSAMAFWILSGIFSFVIIIIRKN
jgi:hypothetical protein